MHKTNLANGLEVTTYPAPPAGFDFEKATES